MSRLNGFPPIASPDAHLLILGSMPGAASLAAMEYYAHPRNVFWRIITTLFSTVPDLPYSDREQLLKAHGIALWDVLASCIRPGSLDAAIDKTSIVVNDFGTFLSNHPHIRQIYFNGRTVESLFTRLIIPNLHNVNKLNYQRLPSTSPANARQTFIEKLEYWRVVAE